MLRASLFCGQFSLTYPLILRLLKNPVISTEHSSASMPPVICVECPKGSMNRFITPPHDPVTSSRAPKNTLSIRDMMMAPAHIGHGSSVTYREQPLSRQSPLVLQASLIASSSACAVAWFFFSRLLRPRPITAPPASTTTQPTGASPSSPASRASARASCI